MRLDVGGARNPEPGFKVLDLLPGDHVDYVCPAWDTPIDDNAVKYLRARHFLEHLSPAEARATLVEWKRILAPGGVAFITVPNLLYHAKQLSMPGASEFLPHVSNFEHAINSIYGWREAGEHMGHQWGYTPQTLKQLFEEAGFICTPLECRECDIYVEVRKGG